MKHIILARKVSKTYLTLLSLILVVSARPAHAWSDGIGVPSTSGMFDPSPTVQNMNNPMNVFYSEDRPQVSGPGKCAVILKKVRSDTELKRELAQLEEAAHGKKYYALTGLLGGGTLVTLGLIATFSNPVGAGVLAGVAITGGLSGGLTGLIAAISGMIDSDRANCLKAAIKKGVNFNVAEATVPGVVRGAQKGNLDIPRNESEASSAGSAGAAAR